MSGDGVMMMVVVGLYLIGLVRLGFSVGVIFFLITLGLLAYALPVGLLMVVLVAMFGLVKSLDPTKLSQIWRS